MTGEPDAGFIRRYLDRLRLLLWCATALPALARACALAAIAVATNTLVIERAEAGPWTAALLSLAGSLGLAVALVGFARALALPSRELAARRVQAAAPGLRNDVESSLELAPLRDAASETGVSRLLVGALLAGTRERLAAVPPGRVVGRRAVGAALLLLAAALFPIVTLALTGGIPAAAVRGLVDPRVYWPLGRVQLTLEPGDIRIGRGRDLVVTARARGARPGSVAVGFDGATGLGSAAMTRGPGGVWTWRFAAVTGDFRYRAHAGASTTPWYRVRVADAPAAGNFEVTYTYPAYSGLGTRSVTAGGDLEALKGTSAAITFAATSDLAKAVLVIGGNRVAAIALGERRHRAAVYLNGETSYRLELEDAEGLDNGGRPEYAIRYLPDAAPTVEISEPAGEIESDPRGAIAVRYRAADDYGLSRLALVVRAAAGERRVPLPLPPGARSAGGEYTWDLAALEPAPGEVLSASVEAADNDTISGPKVTMSAPFTMRIADPRAKREELRETMEKLTDDLVQLLAEELDAQERYEALLEQAEAWDRFPWEDAAQAGEHQEKAREAAARAEERTAQILEAMERDPATREETIYQGELIRQGLEELRERQLAPMQEAAASLDPRASTQDEMRQKAGFLGSAAEQAARKAEQLALMAEAMKRERGLADVARDTGEMADAEEKLLDGLERLLPGDRKAVEEVLRQIDQIEQSLRDLAASLQKESKELPEEFLNSEALENLDLDELLDGLEEIRDLLNKGDVAGAREAARKMAKKLADLRNRLQQAAEEVDEKSRRALERFQRETLPRIQVLADFQKALLERTESLQRQSGPRLQELLREMARTRAAAAIPAEADVLTPAERGRADALAREQEGLRDSAGRLAAEVEALRAALPFLPAGIGRNLEQAAGRMGEAGNSLRQHEPGRSLPPEREALAALLRAREEAAQSLESLSAMQEMRQGASGMPFGMVPGQKPGQGKDSRTTPRGRRTGGRRGTDVRSFLIPGRQDHSVPKVFREEIMKSLQDGYPRQYEERIKDYYQRIAE